MSMTFKYKRIDRPEPLPPTISPMIPVTFKGSKGMIDAVCLLDSGADVSTIPRGLAEIIGLDLSGEKEEIQGIGGSIEAIVSRVLIIIQRKHEKYQISAEVRVIPPQDNEDKFPILIGRKDFFESFNITFKESNRKIILKKV
ncbi:MAG: hypothetical protein KKG13_00250 [Nanoarchaeota archaeon]|nr:hypothetical protein [Nanoarchaeota archaeon]